MSDVPCVPAPQGTEQLNTVLLVISNSDYLEVAARACQTAGYSVSIVPMPSRNIDQVITDILRDGYDMVVAQVGFAKQGILLKEALSQFGVDVICITRSGYDRGDYLHRVEKGWTLFHDGMESELAERIGAGSQYTRRSPAYLRIWRSFDDAELRATRDCELATLATKRGRATFMSICDAHETVRKMFPTEAH